MKMFDKYQSGLYTELGKVTAIVLLLSAIAESVPMAVASLVVLVGLGIAARLTGSRFGEQ